jgi:hypothetical protein
VRPDPAADPAVIRETFSRMLEPVMLQAQGWQALHASAIVGAGGVLVLAGPSHSGKSTLAYALGRRAFLPFADDVVLLSLAGARVLAHRRPFAHRLRAPSRRHFQTASGTIASPAEADRRPETAPVLGVVVLTQRPTPSPITLERCDGPRAFRELLAHAHCFDVEHAPSTATLSADYLTIASLVTVSALTYSSGLGDLPQVLETLETIAESVGVRPFDSAGGAATP